MSAATPSLPRTAAPPATRRRPRRVLAALLAALATGLAGPAAAESRPENVVHVTADAREDVVMDELQVVFSARREGPEAGAVQAQLTEALEAALAQARRAARPGAVEVRTGNFSLTPRYTREGVTSGWVGTAELIVQGGDPAAIAALVGRIGTLSVARTGWGLSDARRAEAEARLTDTAVAQFRAKADRAARLFGFTGWVLQEATVAAEAPPSGVAPRLAMAMRAAAADAAPLPVEAGQATVTVRVQGSVRLTR